MVYGALNFLRQLGAKRSSQKGVASVIQGSVGHESNELVINQPVEKMRT